MLVLISLVLWIDILLVFDIPPLNVFVTVLYILSSFVMSMAISSWGYHAGWQFIPYTTWKDALLWAIPFLSGGIYIYKFFNDRLKEKE
jgi:hypothetical protein